MSDPILGHPKVRHAFRYLIDYDGLGRTILEYQGIPRASLVPLGAFGALDKKAGQPFKLDLARAKQLITEAGYPNGFSKKLILSANNFNPAARAARPGQCREDRHHAGAGADGGRQPVHPRPRAISRCC